MLIVRSGSLQRRVFGWDSTQQHALLGWNVDPPLWAWDLSEKLVR